MVMDFNLDGTGKDALSACTVCMCAFSEDRFMHIRVR